jgi:alginate O-acetyltransferase complex protein AlgI
LLVSSYVFYGFANWKMIPLLLLSTAAFYFLGMAISKTSNPKKSSWLTTFSVILGICILLYFKYFNFFIESFSALFNTIGLQTNWSSFNIIMPIGVSFFTFKLISYVVEIHRGKIEPDTDFVSFATFVAFFPTIMAGPIDRPNKFIPQLHQKRVFNYDLTVDGCRQILWGMFKKMVIADNLALIINNVWLDIPGQTGSTLLLAAIFLSIQFYTDFSGYSDMAIGVGKILGFQVTRNFNYPFFTRNVAEFWRNWHMSLTSWVTDYVFMPLNIKFRNLGNAGIILAVIINMVIIGLWHGSNWTYGLFGLYNGLLFIPLILSGSLNNKNKLKTNKFRLPSLTDFLKMIGVFLLFTFGTVIFRADNLGQAFEYLGGLFNPSIVSYFSTINHDIDITILFTIIMFIIEWFQKDKEYGMDLSGINNGFLRWCVYLTTIFIIWAFMQPNQSPFIYFQF